jgi:hypothetical protein
VTGLIGVQGFTLNTNQPVSFKAFTSLTRKMATSTGTETSGSLAQTVTRVIIAALLSLPKELQVFV